MISQPPRIDIWSHHLEVAIDSGGGLIKPVRRGFNAFSAMGKGKIDLKRKREDKLWISLYIIQ